MATLHGHLSRDRDVELQGRTHQVWVRRGILGLLALFVLAALLNVFGQRSTTSTAAGPEATLTVKAPQHLRGGLIFEGRFEISAQTDLDHPHLYLSPGWTEGMTLNESEPTPSTETSHDGDLVLSFPPIQAGTTFTYWSQWSVNPVNVGHRPQDVTLYEGARQIAAIHRNVTVFP